MNEKTDESPAALKSDIDYFLIGLVFFLFCAFLYWYYEGRLLDSVHGGNQIINQIGLGIFYYIYVNYFFIEHNDD